ncbi:MAG: hypothetical protein JRJ03_13525 [Deltaproteobacteria bacterium]|nr:hypothetical protein [Deltaproteobacteria bacterium]
MCKTKHSILVGILCLAFVVCVAPDAAAAQKRDMGGWEIDGAYNKHYDPREFESFKGIVEKVFTVVPMPGMSPGVALIVRERGSGEKILVHVCPVWFAKPKEIGIRPGDKVKVKGVFAEINGKEIFMASKVKKGTEFEFKVRLTKDGTPFWAMTPEQLAKERGSK